MSDINVDADELVDAFESRLSGKKSDSTTREYTRHAEQYIQWLREYDIPILDARPGEIEEHLGDTASEGYAAGYLKIRRAAIRSLYDMAGKIAESRTSSALADVDPADIEENPAHPDRVTLDVSEMDRGSKQSQHTREDYVAADKDDVEKMVQNVPPSHAGGQDHQLLIKLLYYTGLRKSEVVRIRLSDFADPDTFRGLDEDGVAQAENRSINARATKTDSNRTVFYPPELVSDLDEWVNGVGRDLVLGNRGSKYLFPSPDLGPGDDDQHLSGQHVNRVVKESAENAGIQEAMYEDMNGHTRWKYTTHSLRHGFAERCIEEDMDLRTLAELMGHFTNDGRPAVETTTMYLRGIDTAQQYREHGPPAIEE